MMELPRWAFEVAFAAYAVLVSTIVVLERRKPTATLALLLALILVPIVGLLSYLVLSRHRVQRRRKERSRRAVLPVEQTAAIASLDSLPETMPLAQRRLVKLAISSAAAPLRHARAVTLLPTGGQAFEAFCHRIKAATRTVHCEFYIWKDDPTARAITALLTDRACAGVTVRVLIDAVGSLGLAATHFAVLRAAGGRVALYDRLSFPFWRHRLNFRNHRKIITIDGDVGFLGGLNIGDEYSGDDDHWRDLHVEVTGDAVVGLEAIFLEDWLRTTGAVVDLVGSRRDLNTDFDPRAAPNAELPWQRKRATEHRASAAKINPFPGAKAPTRPIVSEGPLLQIIPSGPDTAIGGIIGAQFTAAIASASHRAWIATPYFVPDEPLKLAMRTAALSGVDVRLLVPQPRHNDMRVVAWAARSYYDELLAAGVRVFEYELGMLHAKYLLVDDVVCAIGSANMDVRSFHLNYEVTAMFYDASVTHALGEIFAHGLQGSVEITATDRESPTLSTRLSESFARVLSPLL